MSEPRRWGLCPWFPEDRDRVHPDDYERLKALYPYCRVFELLGPDGTGHTWIRYGSNTFRVTPTLLTEVPTPAFDFGQGVRLKQDETRRGVITEILWHSKEGRPFYHLWLGGKLASRRFWEEDLVPIPGA